MATTKPQLTAEERARIAQLADQLSGIVAPFKGANADKNDARTEWDNQSKNEVNVREQVMVGAADFSQRHQLGANDISSVAAQVCKRHNDDATRKTFETFVGEIKGAMQPGVRAHVQRLVDLRNETWDAEEERKRLDKDEPTPLRGTFKRKYHMLKQIVDAVNEGWTLDTGEDVETFRQEVETKQLQDYKKVAKELASMAARLRELHQTFQMDDLTESASTIEEITKERLEASLTPKPSLKPVPMGDETTTVVDEATETEALPEVEPELEVDVLADVLG